MPQTSRPRT